MRTQQTLQQGLSLLLISKTPIGFMDQNFGKNNPQTLPEENTYELVDPSSDTEVRPQVSTLKTTMMSKSLGTQRFSKFSTWKSITHAIARLLHISRQFHKGSTTETSSCKGWHYCSSAPTVEELLCAEKRSSKQSNRRHMPKSIRAWKQGTSSPKKASLKA